MGSSSASPSTACSASQAQFAGILGWRRCEANGGTRPWLRDCVRRLLWRSTERGHGQPGGDLLVPVHGPYKPFMLAVRPSASNASRPRRRQGRIAVSAPVEQACVGTQRRYRVLHADNWAGLPLDWPSRHQLCPEFRFAALLVAVLEHLQRRRWMGDPPSPPLCAAISFQQTIQSGCPLRRCIAFLFKHLVSMFQIKIFSSLRERLVPAHKVKVKN